VRPEAIAVMKELRIDISGHRSKNVVEFNGQPFDYVITVCDDARETCPVFFGPNEKLHHSFADPAVVEGSDEERLAISLGKPHNGTAALPHSTLAGSCSSPFSTRNSPGTGVDSIPHQVSAAVRSYIEGLGTGFDSRISH